MANYYDSWLEAWDEGERAKKNARKVIHEEEVEWLSTPQDAKVGLLVAPETGFRTWGSESMIAEIPVGWHTGKHAHGEEGVYITEGEGFSVVNGQRYDWATGSCMWIPFGAEHQHFNTGDVPARYYSYSAMHLEQFLGLLKLEQLETCGPTDTIVDAPVSPSGLDDKGRRIVIGWDDAPRRIGTEAGAKDRQANDKPIEGDEAFEVMGHSHRSFFVDFMGYYNTGNQDFHNREIEITGILGDDPHTHGGKHAHMEATLYVVQGTGYSIVDGERVDWKKGTCFHVQGPQTEHQHYNTGDEPVMQLRCAPGVRANFFQEIAKERFPYLWFEGRGHEH